MKHFATPSILPSSLWIRRIPVSRDFLQNWFNRYTFPSRYRKGVRPLVGGAHETIAEWSPLGMNLQSTSILRYFANLSRSFTVLGALSAAISCAAVLQTAVGAEDDAAAPPPLLKGGFVHQLRSLTEEAKQVLDGSNRSSGRSLSPPRAGRTNSRPQRTSVPAEVGQVQRQPQLPPQPSGRSTLQRTHSSPWVERQQAAGRQQAASQAVRQPTAAVQNQQLARVIRPEDLQNPRQPSKLEPAAGEEVHIESQIPRNVLESIRPRVRSQPVSSQRSQWATGPNTAAPQSRTIDEQLDAPRVSRIPLPGRSNDTTLSGENRLLPQAPDPASLSDSGGLALDEPANLESPLSQPSRTRLDDNSGSSLYAESPDPTENKPETQSNIGPQVTRTNLPSVPKLPDAPAAAEPSTGSVSSLSSTTSSSQPATSNSTSIELPSLTASNQSSGKSPENAGKQTETPNAPSLPAAPAPLLSAAPGTMSSNNLPSPMADASLSSPKLNPPAPTNPAPYLPAAPGKNSPASQTQLETGTIPTTLASPSALPVANSNQTRMSMITPRVQVLLQGPADLPVGKTAKYEIIVNNDDQVALSGLLLQLDAPAGVQIKSLGPTTGTVDLDRAKDGSTMLNWTFEQLAAGKRAVAPLELVASSPKNFAVAMEWTLLPVADLARFAVKAPRLELALAGPSEVDYGKPNMYRLVVRNPGNAVAKDVAVALTAQQYGQSASEIGDIPPGGEESIEVELTFNQKGTINISAGAQSASGLTSETEIDVLVRKPEIKTAIASQSLVYHGSATPVTLTIENVGDATSDPFSASLVLPPGAELSQAPSNIVRVGNEARWTVDRLLAGQKTEIPLAVTFGRAGDNLLKLVCSQDAGTLSQAVANTRVEAVADLILIVNDPPAPAPIGQEVAYTLKLTNRGSREATGVSVIAQFSDGIEPTRGIGKTFRTVPGQLFFDKIDRIEAGQTVELKVMAKASTGGMHRFRAEVRTTDEEMRLVQEEATKYLDVAGRIASPMQPSVIR